ncbi:MAG TPA: ESPR-type extended signal peptide-containing protein, partial [Variovorax sp.]|nr:ESPR-type extended signal peptide-containing protein [Variovorax sp.]
MNCVHRVVFNRSKGVCQAVSEVATGSHGGRDAVSTVESAMPRMSALASVLALAIASMAPASAWAGGGAGGASNTNVGVAGGAGG